MRRGWQWTLDEISKLAEEVRADGATFTLLILPFRFQVEPGAPEPTPQQMLARFARENGITAVDLLPALAPLGTDGFLDSAPRPLASRRTLDRMTPGFVFQ